MKRIISYDKHLKTMLKDPVFKREYERFDLWFEIEEWWVEFKTRIGILKNKIKDFIKEEL